MHALVLLCIHQHMKFEVRSFTNYKGDEWGKILIINLNDIELTRNPAAGELAKK